MNASKSVIERYENKLKKLRLELKKHIENIEENPHCNYAVVIPLAEDTCRKINEIQNNLNALKLVKG